MFAAPIAAGVMADHLGFLPVFAASAVGGSASLVLLMRRVRDPRHGQE